jgi:hypothetical protein
MNRQLLIHTNSGIFQKRESLVEFAFINQRIHSDSRLPPQISNEFKPFSRTLLPKPSFSRVHYDPMLFLWICHFVSLLVILWFNLGTFSSYIKCSVAHMVFVRFYFGVQTGKVQTVRIGQIKL